MNTAAYGTDRVERGVLYVVWGQSEAVEQALNRSTESVRLHHPELPIHVARPEQIPTHPLQLKSQMAALTPFHSTLYLDADTIVMDRLDFAFVRAEAFGLACCINECPWMRRFGVGGDEIEYNTGVIFFTEKSRRVFDLWQSLAPSFPAAGWWTTIDGVPRGLRYNDQASFSAAIAQSAFNPFILPLNYNVRAEFHTSFFAPLKIWHGFKGPPAELWPINEACARGERLVTYLVTAPRASRPPQALSSPPGSAGAG